MVPMRDGVRLATDVWSRRGGAGTGAAGALPYGKEVSAIYGARPNIFTLIEAGYAVVYQDCRGTFRSGGEFTFVNEPATAPNGGLAAGASWCDGNIGLTGRRT